MVNLICVFATIRLTLVLLNGLCCFWSVYHHIVVWLHLNSILILECLVNCSIRFFESVFFLVFVFLLAPRLVHLIWLSATLTLTASVLILDLWNYSLLGLVVVVWIDHAIDLVEVVINVSWPISLALSRFWNVFLWESLSLEKILFAVTSFVLCFSR